MGYLVKYKNKFPLYRGVILTLVILLSFPAMSHEPVNPEDSVGEIVKDAEPLKIEPTIHCFNKSQIAKIADFKKECDLLKADKVAKPEWYRSTFGIITIGVLSFLAGTLGSTK